MDCLKLAYSQYSKPVLRCVYNAADGEEGYAFARNASIPQPFAHNAQPSLLLRRGYTGHEHLPEFGLINMNARLYDPITGRMLSPDPYIMDPAYSQDYNRYTYARNNPLIYIDPSGESLKDWWRKIFGKSEGNSNVAKEHMSDGGGGMGGYEGEWSNYNYNSGDYYNLSGVDISGNAPSQPLPDYSIVNNWDYWNRWNYVNRYNEGSLDGNGVPQVISNITGAADVTIGFVPNPPKIVQIIGGKLQGINLVFDGIQLRAQYQAGRINPLTAASFGTGLTGAAAGLLAKYGIGGAAAPAVGSATGLAGAVLFAADMYATFMSNMFNSLQTSPLYINNGVPYYGEDYYNPYNPYDGFNPYY